MSDLQRWLKRSVSSESPAAYACRPCCPVRGDSTLQPICLACEPLWALDSMKNPPRFAGWLAAEALACLLIATLPRRLGSRCRIARKSS